MIHPFHPYFGRSFLLLHHGPASGADRVLVQDCGGATFYLLTRWTDLGNLDPYVVMAEGRARFRVPDLVLLAGMLAQMKPEIPS